MSGQSGPIFRELTVVEVNVGTKHTHELYYQK